MTPETLNSLAAVSAIYLFINAIIVTLVMAIVIGFAWWYLRKARKALVKPLLTAQVFALRVQLGTSKVADKISGVPIQINSTTTQVATTAKQLTGRTDGKP